VPVANHIYKTKLIMIGRLIESKYIINYRRVVLMEGVRVHSARYDCVLSDKDIYKTTQNCLSFGLNTLSI
jgi:hypothetical protein